MKRLMKAAQRFEEHWLGDAIGVLSLAALLIGGLVLGVGMGWK